MLPESLFSYSVSEIVANPAHLKTFCHMLPTWGSVGRKLGTFVAQTHLGKGYIADLRPRLSELETKIVRLLEAARDVQDEDCKIHAYCRLAARAMVPLLLAHILRTENSLREALEKLICSLSLFRCFSVKGDAAHREPKIPLLSYSSNHVKSSRSSGSLHCADNDDGGEE